MARKIKIGFDVISCWDYDAFRQTMKELVLEEEYELYLITSSTDTEYVDSAVAYIGMNEDNVYQVDEDQIVDTVEDNNLDMYLTYDEDIRESVALLTETVGILVNPALQDSYNMDPKWSTQMQFWIERVRKELGSGQGSNC